MDKSIINGISIDMGSEEKIIGGISSLKLKNKGGGQFEAIDELIMSEDYSVSEVGHNINMMITGQLDASKSSIIIIGEEMAKKGIEPLLEPFYRSKRGYLSSKVIIAKGNGYDILSIKNERSPIAFDILQMIESAETSSVIPKVSIFSLWSKMMDPGKDLLVPMVEVSDVGKIKVTGLSFFNGGNYTGSSISDKNTPILMLLLNKFQIRNRNQINLLLSEENTKDPISLNVKKIKRKINTKVDAKSKEIKYSINLSVSVSITSFPQQSIRKIEIKELNKKISSQLTKQAKQIIETAQKANSDVFGIGGNIKSYYPEVWKEIDWNEEYKNVEIDPKIEVEIIQTGTLY